MLWDEFVVGTVCDGWSGLVVMFGILGMMGVMFI